MLCSCGHAEDRHAGGFGHTGGPCLTCNCSGFKEAVFAPAQLEAVEDFPEPSDEQMDSLRKHLVEIASDLNRPDAA